jgi:hypothetical protein
MIFKATPKHQQKVTVFYVADSPSPQGELERLSEFLNLEFQGDVYVRWDLGTEWKYEVFVDGKSSFFVPEASFIWFQEGTLRMASRETVNNYLYLDPFES